MKELLYPTVLVLALVTAQVSANPYPNSGLLYRDMREDTLQRVLPKGNEPDAIEIPAAEVAVASGPDIHVSQFVVYGNDELSDSELTNLLAPYSDKTLSSLEIQEAAGVLRKAYRTRGVFAAQVYIPPQAIVDGIVTLHVFEGVLEEAGVLLSNEGTQVTDKAISRILEENLATGKVMRRAEFERSILLVDDLPGVTSHSVIYPGTEPGEAQFLLRAEDTPRITGNVDIDNFGSYYTGESRLWATVYFNSPTGSGDQITLRAVTSGSDSNYFFLDYSTPISGNGMRIGAACPLWRVTETALVRERFAALSEAARCVGSRQIQNRATLVGNICNASPAADTAPALLIYDAIVGIRSTLGKRRLPLSEFWLGPRRTTLDPGEWVEYVEARDAGRHGSCYVKLGRTRGVDLALVGAAVLAADDGFRLAYTAVAPTVRRATMTERVLDPSQGADQPWNDVERSLATEIEPIDDVRASARYRSAMALVCTKRGVAIAHERLLEEGDASG